jgi:DNA primase
VQTRNFHFGGAVPVAGLFADDFKELVRSRTDIVSLIAESVALQSQRGGREFVGLCPFHDDHNPSMRVYPERQSFRCWSCNEGGDCFSFVMKRDRIGFRETLEMLAKKANIPLPESFARQKDEEGHDRNRLYEIVAWAEKQFHEFFLDAPQAERARKYIYGRHLSKETVLKYRIGYHPDNWEWLIERARHLYKPEELEIVKLIGRKAETGRYYDHFVDRVVFPIRDTQGRPVAFGGRILPDSPSTGMGKYWNSPEHLLFNKSRLFYGMDKARESISKSGTAVLVEGYTDCIMAHQCGLTNVVAALGTALNENHVVNMKRFARRVVMVLDGDRAGRDAVERAVPRFLPHEVDLRILTLPEDLDPADFLAARGGQPFAALLDTAVEVWEYKYQAVVARYGLDSIDSRHRVLEEMLDTISQVPAHSTGDWALREQVILGKLVQQLKVPEHLVRHRLDDLRLKKEHKQSHPVASVSATRSKESAKPAEPLFPSRPTRDDLAEREVLELIFTYPDLAEVIRQEIAPEDLLLPRMSQLLEVCFSLHGEGIPPSYERVTSHLEDPDLKNLAALIDEHARQVAVLPEHVSHTLQFFRRRRAAGQLQNALMTESHAPPAAGVLDAATKARLRLATELKQKQARRL